MYKVLIIDDEPWVALGIKMLIDWESLGFEVIGEAFNGLAALKDIMDKRPDVVISDIRMPGLTGLELLEKIKNRQIETSVVLVSGHAEFEYAQKAVQLGAFDYLLKQIDKDRLAEVMKRLYRVLSERQTALQERDMYLDDLFELLRADGKLSAGGFVVSKGHAHRYPHFRFLSFSFSDGNRPNMEEKRIELEEADAICLRTGYSKISVLVNYDARRNPEAYRTVPAALFGGALVSGISTQGEPETLVSKLYLESDIAIKSAAFYQEAVGPEEEGRPMNELEYHATEFAEPPVKILSEIEMAVREKNQEQINKRLWELYVFCRERTYTVDFLAGLYNKIISLHRKHYPFEYRNNEPEYLGYQQLIGYFSSAGHMFETLKSLFDKRDGELSAVSNEMVRKILCFMDEHYTEDIMLSYISRKFNISLGYLSALIKRETGTTYTEYIIKKRLNMARELLQVQSLSIDEIVQRVGYHDYFYFNKLFKKYVGITPGKYRKTNDGQPSM